MASRALEKRLQFLEQRTQAELEQSLWVNMDNNHITLGLRKKQEFEFPSVYEAARWLENQIDTHPGATGSIIVDNLCDLYPDSEALKDAVSVLFGNDKIKTPLGEFSKEQMPGVRFGSLKTDQPADINFWLLASQLHYFGTLEFSERNSAGQLTIADNQMFYALLTIYCWGKKGDLDTLFDEFIGLFHHVARIPKLEAA